VALMVVLHRVKDYAAWRKGYDEAGPLQKAGGVTAESVFRAKDDPNNVLVLHHFATTAEAEAFMARDDLRAAMQRAGIDGTPRFELFDEP
jgi:hypothetical protein